MQTQQITHLNFAKGFRGGERQTQLLIEELSKQGYKQKLLVRKNSELAKRCENIANVKIIEISKPYIFHIKQIKGSSLLHAHETKALQFAYLAHKITQIPYVVTRRVDNQIKNNFFNKKLYQSAKKVVALSQAIEKEILSIVPNANTTIIPSAFTDAPINQEKSRKIRERFKNKFLVGHIGALDDKHKGQSFLIETAKLLQKNHPEIHVLFVGSGQDELMLKNFAKGYNNITFEGFVNNVNDYIHTFDLFVFPSRNEGLGSILFDVMQLEVPIIASNIGGIPDIIENGVNGILIPPCNAQEIKNKIIELEKDKVMRDKLVSNAKKIIPRYSSHLMSQKYRALYESL